MSDIEIIEYWKNIGAHLQYVKDLLLGKLRNSFQPYWNTSWNGSQITENIWISDIASAYNYDKLKDIGITHVLTIVLGISPVFPDHFQYMNIPAQDIPDQDLQQYFLDATNFIDNAIKNNGKVLVHCSYGVSRSASMVIAYLMRTGHSYDDVLAFVQSKRSVVLPNPGFEQQLRIWEKNYTPTVPITDSVVSNSTNEISSGSIEINVEVSSDNEEVVYMNYDDAEDAEDEKEKGEEKEDEKEDENAEEPEYVLK
jgi:atypical dual specificity phosphatase